MLLKLPAALLADAQRSITAVDVSNPDKPVVSVSLPSNLGGAPVDIAAFGNIAMTAEVSFGRAIPIVNISSPLNPSSVGFWTLQNPGFSSSIAVDISFGYAIVPATSTLRILKYQDITDPFGIPPTISITSPVCGTALIQGQTVTVSANATDDVAVASVSFFVDGQFKFTSASPPYQFNYTVPSSATTLTFGATALDYGNLTGTAPNCVGPVIPDPLTTATGKVTDSNGTPLPGATVSVLGLSTQTKSDGTFTLPGLPTIKGPIVVTATVTVNGIILSGQSAPATPVMGGTTNVGTIKVFPFPVFTSLSRKSALPGSQVTLQVTGTSLANATFVFQPPAPVPIGIQRTDSATNNTSATLALNIPDTATIGTFALVATTLAGSSDTNITKLNRFTVVDPNSTADTDGDTFQDVIEAVFGTDPLDPLSFPVIPTATETESVAFSVLNAPLGGIVETESVAFSVLNAPLGGIVETESVAFSVLNAPRGGNGETESRDYGVLNTLTAAPKSVTDHTSTPKPSNEVSANDASPTTPVGLPIDPFLDSDGDGLPDWFELLIGTDPYNPDTDGEGLTDYEEVFVYHTNPLDPDTDGDGFADGLEVLFGSDPLSLDSTPLNVARRASTPLRASDSTVVAANKRINTNSTRQGDSHVKQLSKRPKRGQAPSSSALSGSFAPRRANQ